MLTSSQVTDLRKDNGSVGMPAFIIRRKEQLNDVEGQNAITNGFLQVPIYNARKAGWDNDLDFASCHFAGTIDNARMKNDDSYRKVMWLKDAMKDKYHDEFDLTDEQVSGMTFYDAYMYSDAIYSMRFEGLKTKVDYNDTEIGLVNTTQIYGLMNPLT